MLLSSISNKIQDNGTIVRTENKISTNYNANQKILSLEKPIKFKSIKKSTNDKSLPFTNIGVIDLETFNIDDVARCYAIGFHTHDSENPTKFYIGKDLESFGIIHSCFDTLLKRKFSKTVFYCHNLGRFDAPFIIKALLEMNNRLPHDSQYVLDIFSKESTILLLK